MLTLFLAWFVSPTELGAISFVLAYYGIFSILADWSVAYSLQKFIPEDQRQFSRVVGTSLAIRLSFSCALAAICIAGDAWLGMLRGYGGYVAILLITSTFALPAFAYNAAFRFEQSSMLTIGIQVSWLVMAMALVALGLRVAGPILALAASFLVFGGSAFFLDVSLRRSLAVDHRLVRRLLSFGAKVTLATTLSAMSVQCGVLVLTYLQSEERAAIYKLAMTVALAPLLVGGVVQQPLQPIVSRSLQGNREEVASLLRLLMRYLMLFGLPLFAAGAVLAGPLLQVFFSAEYMDGIWAVRWLLAANVLSMLFTSFSTVMIFGEGVTAAVGINMAVGVVALSASLLLVPVWGVGGAAVAQWISFAMGVALLTSWLRRKLALTIEWKRLGVYALSAAEMALLTWLAVRLSSDARLQLVVGCATALIAYGIALFLQHGVTSDELRKLVRQFRAAAIQ
jgi:O-antigen/teichoic acid export membrane protein